MNDNPFNNRRPTPLEERAYTETKTQFAEQLRQSNASRAAVQHLERNLTAIAAELLGKAVLTEPRVEDLIQTDDGQQWHKGVNLLASCHFCHRSTGGGKEFAVVEQFPSRKSNEVLARGTNVMGVLQTFTRDQQQVFNLWTDDMTAQIKEFLTDKYPGQDLSRVADSFMHRFTEAVPQKEVRTQQQKHSRGIRI